MISLSQSYCKLLVFCCLSSLFACNKQGAEQIETKATIDVDIVDIHSKNAVMHADSILSLGIFGYSTGIDNFDPLNPSHTPDLFYNRQVSRNTEDAWVYDAPVVYWPVDPAIKNSFFAYSPHASKFPAEADFIVSNETASDFPTITYTIPDEVSRQIDILYSTLDSTYVLNINRNTNNGKVRYTMRHALAWIGFLIAPVERQNPNETYTLKSLYGTAKNVITRARFNLGTGTWSGLASSSAHYRLEVNSPPIRVGTIARPIDGSNYLMMIPQPLTLASNEPMINLSFTFNDGTGGPQDDYEYFYSVPFPDTRLNAGRIIIYILKISVDGVSIIFNSDNTIEEWIEDPSVNIIEVY